MICLFTLIVSRLQLLRAYLDIDNILHHSCSPRFVKTLSQGHTNKVKAFKKYTIKIYVLIALLYGNISHT